MIQQIGNGITSIARAVSHILLQGALAYDNSKIDRSHTAFVLRMERTVFQLSMAKVSLVYLEELIHSKPMSEDLEVFHSERYDLRKTDDRREALRLVIGLYRYISAEGMG